MARKTNKLFYTCGFLALVISSSASFLLDSLISDADPCEDVCHKTYPPDTYKSALGDCCWRGCHLYLMITHFVGEADGVNGTLSSCYDNCKDAYPSEVEDTSACMLGCRSQRPVTDRHDQLKDLESSIPEMDMSHLLYPLMYMHNIYSNMVDKVTNQMCVSWSFFMRDGQGHMMVIQPQILDMDVQDFDDDTSYRGTSSVLETNIEPSGNMATEVLRHSQLKSARSLSDEVGAAQADPWKHQLDDANASDWLTCIARKTKVPRLLLSVLILFSAVAMVWLCMSAAVTAPDQRVSQKLSIQGDLEYLRYLPDKKGITGVHPQDFVQARPLPMKIRIEQI